MHWWAIRFDHPSIILVDFSLLQDPVLTELSALHDIFIALKAFFHLLISLSIAIVAPHS
jgi:hypothetical protein